jgi:peptide/nickel transport system substrate-binding protein
MVKGAGVTGVGLTTAALVGCGGGDDNKGGTTSGTTVATQNISGTAVPTAVSAEKPKKGGHLTAALAAEPRSLDFHFDVFIPVADHTNNALLKFNTDVTQIETDAATALPEQPDGLTYVFKIRPGIKFHNVEPVNGRELTSADVKFSIERQIIDDAGKYQHAYFFRGKIASIETPDKYTIVFKMTKKFAPFLAYMANAWTLITAPEIVSKFGDLTQVAIGTGPFIFKEWQKNVRMEMVRNPDYFKPDRPYIDQLTYLIAPDPDVNATLFIEKKTDVYSGTATQMKRVKEGRKDATYKPQPQQGMQIIRMPPTIPGTQAYASPYDDIRVRQAIVQAINKKEIYDLVYSGEAIPAFGPMPPAYTAWSLKEDPAPFDLKKATDLMSAAGKANGFTEKFLWASLGPATDQQAEVTKQQLAKIKVNLELTPMELAAYYNLIYTYKYNMAFHTTTSTPDPDEALAAYYGKTSTYYKYDGSANGIWDAIDKQGEELDSKARKVLVEEVQKRIVQQYPVAFSYSVLLQQFIDPKVKNWFFSIDGYNVRCEDLWLNA